MHGKNTADSTGDETSRKNGTAPARKRKQGDNTIGLAGGESTGVVRGQERAEKENRGRSPTW